MLSSQHSPETSDGLHMKPAFIEAVIEETIKPVLPKECLINTKYLTTWRAGCGRQIVRWMHPLSRSSQHSTTHKNEPST